MSETETTDGYTELVQCEWCEVLVSLDNAHEEQFPGATLTFCDGCYNE